MAKQIKKEEEKKNIVINKLLVLVVLLIVGLVFGISYSWIRLTKNSETVNKITAGSLELDLSEVTDGIKLVKAMPKSYQQGLNTPEYKFKLENKGNTKIAYKLTLNDEATFVNDDNETVTVTNENKLADKYIRYLLVKGNDEKAPANSKLLSTTLDRVIDQGEIEANSEIEYTLQMWIDSRAGNNNTQEEILSKYFNAKLNVEAEQTEIEKIVLTFDGAGGTDYTIEKNDSGQIGTLPTPTRTGYRFLGWYSAATGGTEITSATEFTTNTTYYAHWEANTYTLTFDGNGGSDGSQITKACDEEIGSLPQSERAGYEFEGWYTEEVGGEKISTTTKVPPTDKTYYAHWTAIDYTVTFNGNGGENSPSITRHYNEEVGSLPSPEREGYTFEGWYTESTGGEKISATTKVKESITYYAHWEAVYTVTYNYQANGGDSTTGITTKPAPGTNVDLTPKASKAGWEFVGWNEKQTEKTKLDSLTMPSKNVVLYAIFRKQIEITFNKNGADTQTVSGGSASSNETVTVSCYMYNNEENCSVISPTIGASTATPTVIGYSTSTSDHTSDWNENTSKAVNTDDTYYAQTTKAEQNLSATLTKDDETVESITSTSVSCTIDATYNGVVQATSCTAPGTSIDFTPKSGYEKLGWFLSTNETETPDVKVGKPFTINAGETVTYVAYGNLHEIVITNRYSGANPANYVTFNDETAGWRIIGTYDGMLKIIRNEYVISKSWHQWKSGVWTNSEEGRARDYLINTYYDTLTDNAKNMIEEDAKWYIGKTTYTSKTDETFGQAKSEIWTGRVGLMSVFEYLYAADESCWETTGNNYNSSCADLDWLKDGYNEWTINKSDSTNNSCYVKSNGQVYTASSQMTYYLRPVVHLKSSVHITGGSGTDTDPFTLG